MNNYEPEVMEEVARLARSAEEVFATHADLRDWLACVLRRCLHGFSERSREPCGKVAAAACAIRFKSACPLSSTPSEFAEVMNRLPTSRLEALMRLKHDADAG